MKTPAAIFLCRRCGYKYLLVDDGTNNELRIGWFCMVDDHMEFCANQIEILLDKPNDR